MSDREKEIKKLWREYRKLIGKASRLSRAGYTQMPRDCLAMADKLKQRAIEFEAEHE